MKLKRVLSLVLSILMCLSMMSAFVFSADAATQENIVLKDDMIFVNLSWTPANVPAQYELDGKVFDLVWGVNAFGNAQKAVDAAPEFGTVYLCAGGFVSAITIKKSLTILGAKYGIDPNVKGAQEKDLWTLNPERGQDETILEATVNLGVAGNTVYDKDINVVIDGVTMTGQGQFASNNGAEGRAELKFKNIYIKDSLHTSPIFFLCPYYNAATNAYRRFVTIDNLRIEGATNCSNVAKITADYLDISGVYMAPDCVKPFFDSASAPAGTTDEVYWSLHDSMFAATIGRTIYFNWENPSSNGASLASGAAGRSKVVTSAYNNVFVNNYKADGDSTNSTLAFRLNTENVYYNFVGNAFYHDRTPVSGHADVSGYSGNNKNDYSNQVVFTANRFYGETLSVFNLNQTTKFVNVDGNYAEKNGAMIAVPFAYPDKTTHTYDWKDEAMTVKSTEEGEGHARPAVTEVETENVVTASLDLPFGTCFVNPAWTESTVPADITVRNRKVELIWGYNAFADIASASTAAPDYGTLYLCAGTYADAVETTKNLTILGAKFGIDPNVRGQKLNDPWTLNSERGQGESIITASFNLSASTSADNADFMVVDGIELTAGGNLRSNAASIQGYGNVVLKNIYIKDSTTNPFYLYPAWPGTGANANTFRRDVTIENVRVEGQIKDAVLKLVAQRADISGVYMHSDCTKRLLDGVGVDAGSSSAAYWNIHDNMLNAVNTADYGMYLQWETFKGSNGNAFVNALSTRSKAVANVNNNVFINTDIAFCTYLENVYHNFCNNAFFGRGKTNETVYGYCDYNQRKDFSDQIVVKDNKFIGDISIAYYLKNNKGNVDVSGNFSYCDGAVIPMPLHENSKATENWYWTNAAMTKRSDDTSVLKAPVAVNYQINEIGNGIADGKVTVSLPADHGAEKIYLFWGDENGKLAGYSGFAPIKVSGREVMFGIDGGTFIPAEATHLIAYSYSDACGISEGHAAYELPEGAAMEDLGKPVLEFQSVSDMHISTTTNTRQHHSQHLTWMLEDVKTVSPDSIGVIANGDTADRGYDGDYDLFNDLVDSVDDAPAVYVNVGNHEFFRYGTPIPSGKTLKDFSEPFYENMVEGKVPSDTVYPYEGALSYSFEKNGYRFVFLGTDVMEKDWIELNSTTLNWLKGLVQANHSTGRPIFIFMHQNMANTYAGSTYVKAATETALNAMLVQYPEVIMFNGHSHTSMYDPVVTYRGDTKYPTVFNTSAAGYVPTTAYNEAGSVVSSEGYYVYVYENKIVIRGRDFINNQWISAVQMVVDLDNTPAESVAGAYYGKSKATAYVTDGKLSGTISCYLPIKHNASDVALFFGDADACIIGDQPFATAAVADTYTARNVSVGFVDVAIPENADYILLYSYSEDYGWSADFDVFQLSDCLDGTELLASENVSESGNVKADKHIYKLGDPIYITGIQEKTGDWIGMNLSSATSGSKMWWKLTVSGSDVPFDITKQSNFTSHNSADYKFAVLEAGEYQMSWISIDNPKQTFQTGKLAEHIITFLVVDCQTEQLGTPDVHSWETEYTVDVAPTCGEEGSKSFHCAHCDAVNAASVTAVPATGNHTAGELVVDTAATCVSKGTGHKNCTVCGQLAEGNIEIPVDATNHSGVNHTANAKDATCVEDGYTGDTVCECGVVVQSGTAKPATGNHTAGELIVDTAATCVTKGTGHKNCTVCGQLAEGNIEIAIDPTKHSGVNHNENAKDATCGAKGYTGDTVCECGVIVQNGSDIPATGNHTAGEWKVVKEATTKAEGLKEQRCTVCNTLLKSEIIAKKKEEAPKVNFTDVKKSDFFYTPVQWAVANGVTTGTSKTTFGPNESCTRAQAVTFLWRAAGQPAPKSTNNPFKDVKKSDYFYKAVLWAAGSGVTSGTSKTEFSPDDVCTRGQIVTFLWRSQGQKKVTASNPFTDVKKSDFYYNAVLWAVKNNVTAGTSKTTFEPNANCTRGQIVTFLHRAVAK